MILTKSAVSTCSSSRASSNGVLPLALTVDVNEGQSMAYIDCYKTFTVVSAMLLVYKRLDTSLHICRQKLKFASLYHNPLHNAFVKLCLIDPLFLKESKV